MKGYTLIELIIVISILMILTGISVLNINSLNTSTNLDGATKDIARVLKMARNNSMSALDGKTWGVHFEARQAMLYYDDGSGFQENNVKTKINVPAGVNLQFNLGGTENLIFQKITGNANPDGVVDLTQNSAKRTISINPEGMVDY